MASYKFNAAVKKIMFFESYRLHRAVKKLPASVALVRHAITHHEGIALAQMPISINDVWCL